MLFVVVVPVVKPKSRARAANVATVVPSVMFAPTTKLKPCAFLAPAEDETADSESDVSVDAE